jgi:hypothetical protein
MIEVFVLGGLLAMTQPARVTNTFQFHVRQPLQRTALLFGPEGERCWAGPGWDPQFQYPQPATDVEGAVFTVAHGPHTSIWVNTIFDTSAGRMQYVAVIPGVVASVIDVRLKSEGPKETDVEVTYTRTALNVSANEDVEALGKKDQESGPEWESAIEKCLGH